MSDTFINNRYRVIEAIGKGGFSNVYCVFDVITKKTLAAKVLNHTFTDVNERKYKQFRQEAMMMAGIVFRMFCKYMLASTINPVSGKL